MGGAAADPVEAGTSIALQVAGVGGVPAAGVDAVVLNLTGTEPSSATFVTAWPDGQPMPVASNLNPVAGQEAPNLAIVKVGAGGRIRLYNNGGSVHLIADVTGWFASGGDYAGVVPARILDTRQSADPVEGGTSTGPRATSRPTPPIW